MVNDQMPSSAPPAALELPDYETVALVLQGGGALGSYQAGVYQGLHEAGVRPNWYAGISIGAINVALIAGNPPERRLARLTEFWETVCRPNGPASGILDLQALAQSLPGSDEIRAAANALSATRTLFEGQQGFFAPRLPPPWLQPPGTSAALSWYDTGQLRGTLERLVDFDLLNAADARVSVGAVCVETGNFEYFDSAKIRILPEHIMASGALPPGFPPVQVGNRSFWDGGLVSNTPLMHVLGSAPRHDTLAFQVDLWSSRGPMPKHLFDVMERTKDIQYSSRTRMVTDVMLHIQRMRRIIRRLSERLTPEQLDAKLADEIATLGCDKVYNIIHLIYRAKAQEGQSKDYEFGLTTMRDHWGSGLADIRRTLARREWLERPDPEIGVVTHDVHRTEPGAA
jgi:NTE family protein